MDEPLRRLKLIETVLGLPADQLSFAADALDKLSTVHANSVSPAVRPEYWPHAPRHKLTECGAYMVTTGTYRKAHIFRDAQRLSTLESSLLTLARKYDWHLEAWAIFSNHYHFVGYTESAPTRLPEFLTELHANSARDVNRLDGEDGRQVWHNFWDKHLTFEKSYLARLNYVHHNAVKHGLVELANQYRWCSAAWFERTARRAQVQTIYGFKTDQLKVADDFEPLAII
jgi:putative transposase